MFAARHFPRRVDSSLVVEGILNGEAMCTDPVPQCGGILQVQTELAWEMEPKALQQHKIHRTPIKIKVCFCVCAIYLCMLTHSQTHAHNLRPCKIICLFIIQLFPENRGGRRLFIFIRHCLFPFPGLN